MGQFASRIHSKEDGKIYNILPMGEMPTVVFGRIIRPNSLPGMQYYFSDGRVKYKVPSGSDKQAKQGWNFTIPFTKQKKFSAIRANNGGEDCLYRRYKGQDRKGNLRYAWAYVNGSIDVDIDDASIDWGDIDIYDVIYTDVEAPGIGSYDIGWEYEILDFSSALTSSSIHETQIPVIFTVPENLDYSRMDDVEYVRQFCRTAKNLDANTVSKNFVIRRGKIICVKEIDFGNKKIFHNAIMTGEGPNNRIWEIGDFNKKYFKYAMLKQQHGKHRLNISKHARNCIHNEFYLIPIVKRGKKRKYKSTNWYLMHKYKNRNYAGENGTWSFAALGGR